MNWTALSTRKIVVPSPLPWVVNAPYPPPVTPSPPLSPNRNAVVLLLTPALALSQHPILLRQPHPQKTKNAPDTTAPPPVLNRPRHTTEVISQSVNASTLQCTAVRRWRRVSRVRWLRYISLWWSTPTFRRKIIHRLGRWKE